MDWVDVGIYKTFLRDTSYNRPLLLNRENVMELVDNMDTLAESITRYSDLFSSLKLYPFRIRRIRNDDGHLQIEGLPDIGAVSVNKILPNYYYLFMGQHPIYRHFNNFADYNGYTTIKLYLPMLGYVSVDTNPFVGKWLQIRLLVDYNTGIGTYLIGVSDEEFVDRYEDEGEIIEIAYGIEGYAYPSRDASIKFLYTFECKIAEDIPLGSSNAGDITRNLLLGAVKVATSTGASIYAQSLPSPTTTTSSVTTATKDYNVYTRAKEKGRKNIPLRVGSETETKKTTSTKTYHKPVDKSKPISTAINGSIDTINSCHGYAGCDRPSQSGIMKYMDGHVRVVIERPKYIQEGDYYAHLYGYPLGEVRTLSDLSGYTEINSIHFEGAGFETITKAEIAMLEQAFSDGVYL